MLAAAMLTLIALLAVVWTTAFAWTSALPGLLWLERARHEDAWLSTIAEMHATLRRLDALP